VIGHSVQILFPPATVKQTMSLIRETITGDKWKTVEIDILHRDGSIRTLLWNSVTLFSPDGRTPIAIIAQGHEITDRKKAEIALQMQAERLRNLHIIDQAILQAIESPEEVVQTALEHIRSLLRCQRASVGIFDLEKKDVRIFAADVDGKTIVKTGNILTEEIYGVIEILRQSRIEIVEDMSKVPMPSATNLILQAEGIQSSINVALISELEMYGVLNVGWENPKSINQEEIDIASEAAIQITIGIEKARLLKETKRYALELEDRVIQRTAQLNAVNDELESFSYSVSHDLRAPLRGIDGFSNILLEDYSDKVGTEGQRLLHVIRDSTKKMGQLIDDLLSFSRIGKRELDKSDVDMKILARSIYSELTTDEERKKIVFSITNIPHTNGDPPLVRQLWINIISNAIKFTKNTAQPMIEIGSKKERGTEWYFIKDNGIGFDMKYYNKLFGVFQRLHSKAEYEGTGIGLSISKRIVNKHGGDIWAESELNVGTTICFTI
jgi:signal transduction histidine kinase